MPVERVLVVDDDTALLNIMSLALRRQGYQVEQAEDGFSALDILGAQPPFSVLLTDLKMPGMSGLELLRSARKIDEHLEVVVVTTGSDLESAISVLRADGAYDFLLKPFESMRQMLMAIERAAAHRQLMLESESLHARLQRENQLLHALTTNTGDAIFSANSAGVLQIANPAAARLLGTDNAEGSLAQSCLPTALSALIANWQAVGGSRPAVIEMPWPNGSVQLISLNPVYEPGGSQLGWVAMLRDITHVKHMQELKTQVLTETAARIRTPLAEAMNSLVELNILTNQNRRVSQVVYRLTQIWKRIQEWGDDLNALIRIDAQTGIHSASIDLQPVFQELVHSQCEPAAKWSGLVFELLIDPHLPEVWADPDLLRRLLYGLINRAVARSERGCSIRLQARSHNNQVWISVSDDGPAVNEADLPHLFEKTFVKDSRCSSATGLEMALVKTIADRMQGQVWVGGQDKKGSTIFVSLPAQLAAQPVLT